jgi:Toprim domain
MNERAAWAEQARAVRIEDEIARRGIRLRGGIDRCGPCPVCGGTDGFSINLKKQVFNCRRGLTGGDVIALVQHLDSVGYLDVIAHLAGAAPQRTVCSIPKQPDHTFKQHEDKSQDNASKAAWLWDAHRPIAEDCPAGLYLRKARGYGGPIPSTLGYLPANGKHAAAMIAAFGFGDELEPRVIDPPPNVTGVHITRLTQDGRKAAIDPVKIMLGPSAGLPIVLAPANDLLAIDIAEGIEKGLLIQADTGAGMWAAGAAGRMPALAACLPAYVECVTIWADRDETGLRFAREAALIIQARKIEVRIKGIPDGQG